MLEINNSPILSHEDIRGMLGVSLINVCSTSKVIHFC